MSKLNEQSFLSPCYRNHKGGKDSTLPKDPFSDPDWEDVSHPEGARNGHHKFKNKRNGDEVNYDKGDPNENGHESKDHYHRPNPNSKDRHDYYLDENGYPCRKGSDESHLYPD